MNEDLKSAVAGMIESAMASFGERLSKLESGMPKPADANKPVACSSQEEIVQLAAKEAAAAALKEFAKTIGAPAPVAVVSAEAPAPAKVEAKTFEALVADKAGELKGDKAAAIAFCVKNHATEYSDYRTRVQGGASIKL